MAGAFTVMPMRQTIELVPGQTYTGYITVANPQAATEDFHYFATAVPYSVIGEDYQADFATKSNRTLMADWITIENPRGEVAPNGTEKIYYTIKVPESVPAGGQYAAIAVSSDTDMVARQGLNVQSVFEIASALYAVVDGETEHAGEVLENKVPGFSTTNDVKTTLMLRNDGNVHESAKIKMTVKEVLTGNIVVGDDGTYEEVIMPESTRYVSRQIDHLASLGIYEVKQSVEYLGAENDATGILIVCPVWFMALVVGTIIVLIWTIKRLTSRKAHAKMEV